MSIKRRAIALAGLAALGWVGCAGPATHGSVEEAEGEHRAKVEIGSDDLKVGDRVGIYSKSCASQDALDRGYGEELCEDQKLGEGEVIAVEEESSIVQVDPDVDFEMGSVVLKET